MNEIIKSLLKDRSLMDQFMQGRLQLEGIPSVQQHALRDVLVDKQSTYFVQTWM